MLKSKFIADILELLLDGDNYGIKTRPQIEFITESDYEYTGYGVFIGFEPTKGIEKYRFEEDDLIIDGVEIKSSELEIGANCTLFFSNGIINNLEIFSYGGTYPYSELKNYELTQTFGISPRKIIKNR